MPSVTIRQALETAARLQQAGRPGEAEEIFRQVLAAQPDNSDALHLLGLSAQQRGDTAVAAQLLGRAVGIAPGIAEYQNNFGVALADLGRHQEAITAYRTAIARKPEFAEAHNNLGNSLRAAGECSAAIAAFEAALGLRPDLPQIHFNLANSLQDAGLLPAAIQRFEEAIKLQPNYPEALNNLAYARRELGQLDTAAADLRRAIEMRPDYAEAYTNFGNVMKDLGQIDQAIGAYKTATSLKADFPEAQSDLIYALHFHPAYDAAAIARQQEQWRLLRAEPLKAQIQPHANDRSPARRLRIGYVSPDFRDHVIGRNILPLLKRHDADQVEIFCYAGVVRPDAMTARFKSLAHHWRDSAALGDAQLAEQICRDGIDILVDLTLHLEGSRLLTFARKPAPVQFCFAGYPGGTGLDVMDYRLSDAVLDPPGLTEHFYREKTLRLESFWCFDPAEEILGQSPPVSALPAERNGHITFGCLNNFGKVTEEALDLWREILLRVKDSHLVLLCPEGSARRRVREALAAGGIAEDRVEFVARQPRQQYLALHNRIDLMLDTFPYNGHSTTLDALWMGVPTVTLAMPSPMPAVGRGGKSILSNLGLAELAAESPEGYVKIAAELAGDLPKLSRMRQEMRGRMRESVLMNAGHFAHQIERVYRQAWKEQCKMIG